MYDLDRTLVRFRAVERVESLEDVDERVLPVGYVVHAGMRKLKFKISLLNCSNDYYLFHSKFTFKLHYYLSLTF